MKVLCCVCLNQFPWPDGAPDPGSDHVSCCPSCLADSRLGRLVRNLPPDWKIVTNGDRWYVDATRDTMAGEGATPEEALAAAGVKEVER